MQFVRRAKKNIFDIKKSSNSHSKWLCDSICCNNHLSKLNFVLHSRIMPPKMLPNWGGSNWRGVCQRGGLALRAKQSLSVLVFEPIPTYFEGHFRCKFGLKRVCLIRVGYISSPLLNTSIVCLDVSAWGFIGGSVCLHTNKKMQWHLPASCVWISLKQTMKPAESWCPLLPWRECTTQNNMS